MCISRSASSTTQSLAAFGQGQPQMVSSSSLGNGVFPALSWFPSSAPHSPESRATGSSKNLVQHNYHDHSQENVDEVILSRELLKARGGVATPFPIKLHSMLKCVESDGHSHIVRWAPHGRAFVVHKPKEFVDVVLRKYFNQTKIASFQRQLNLYGFNRLTQGPDKNGYYHELFIRSKPLLAHKIHRFKIKGTLVRQRANPDQEPNFYNMPPLENNHIVGTPEMPPQLLLPTSPKSVLSPTISPEDVVSASSTIVDPLFCFEESIQDMHDDTTSAFGKDFHDASTEQLNGRYELDNEFFTQSFDTAKPDEVKSVQERSDFEGPTLLDEFDDTPIELDEDFTELLESIVSL